MPANTGDLLKGEHLNEITHSDVGVESLLSRLKQSIYSCKEFAQYIKKLATLESEHALQLKKNSRTMAETFKRPEIPKGTFQTQIVEIIRSNERLADAGNHFIESMHRITEEMTEIVKNSDRQRKLEKDTALRNEKNLLESEQMAEKAKLRYDSAAEEFERARSGDPSKKIALRQKSEEELQKKMTVAEMDYQQKVDAAVRLRRETENRLRVESISKIKALILETDEALVLQLTRFANLNEALQLNRGFVVAPIKPANAPHASQGIKEMANKIDPQLDLYNYILDIPRVKKYLNRQPVSFVKHSGSITNSAPMSQPTGSTSSRGRDFSSSSQMSKSGNTGSGSYGSAPIANIPPPSRIISSGTAKSGPVLAKPKSTPNSAPTSSSSTAPVAAVPPVVNPSANNNMIPKTAEPKKQEYDPSQHTLPTYGTPLEKLLVFEDSTVPRVVYQCVQAIDNFGLEVADIYKTQGNAAQVAEIKRLFDIDAAAVDLLRPSKSLNDIHSVASALKLYFKELPDPLLTREHNDGLINAISITDETRRRDTIHTIINLLPDANYTTLRYLIFHLYRVQELQGINKMSINDIGLVWGPVLMAADYSNTGEVPTQAAVLSIILTNAYAIFDAE